VNSSFSWRQVSTGLAVALFATVTQGATAVTELPNSTYSVSASHGSITGSWERAERDAVATANEFCKARGKVFAPIGQQRSGVYGWSPQVSTVTFRCDPDTAALLQSASSKCRDQLQTPELDPIRTKVELYRESSESAVPFAIATNDAFPTQEERTAIAKWATLREDCIKQSNAAFSISSSATPLQVTQIQTDRSFEMESSARVGELIVSLYQQKLTYGEFAKKRYEITRDAAAAERQYRQSTQLVDQQQRIQVQQLAQQQFQNNLAAWTAYIQAVNARQPQTVHLDGTIRVVR